MDVLIALTQFKLTAFILENNRKQPEDNGKNRLWQPAAHWSSQPTLSSPLLTPESHTASFKEILTLCFLSQYLEETNKTQYKCTHVLGLLWTALLRYWGRSARSLIWVQLQQLVLARCIHRQWGIQPYEKNFSLLHPSPFLLEKLFLELYLVAGPQTVPHLLVPFSPLCCFHYRLPCVIWNEDLTSW